MAKDGPASRPNQGGVELIAFVTHQPQYCTSTAYGPLESWVLRELGRVVLVYSNLLSSPTINLPLQFTNFVLKPGQDHAVVGHGVLSCTKDINPMPIAVEGYQGSIVDTPGFDDSDLPDSEILKRIADWMEFTYRKDIKLTGILYLRDISDARMTGSSKKNFRMFRKLCGTDQKALANVKIVTTKWDTVTPEVGEMREAEFAEHQFGEMLKNGAQMLRHDNTRESALGILSTILGKGSIETRLQDQLVNKGIGLIDTDAGAEVMDDLEQLQRKHEEDLRQLHEDLVGAAEQDKKELREAIEDLELEREQDRVRAEHAREVLERDRKKDMDKLQADLDKLAASKGENSTAVIADLLKNGIPLAFQAYQTWEAKNAREKELDRQERNESAKRTQELQQKQQERDAARDQATAAANIARDQATAVANAANAAELQRLRQGRAEDAKSFEARLQKQEEQNAAREKDLRKDVEIQALRAQAFETRRPAVADPCSVM